MPSEWGFKMPDKQQILIISDSITESSQALERALGAMFKDSYYIRCVESDIRLSQIKEIIAADQQSHLLSVFDDILQELQDLTAINTDKTNEILTEQQWQKYAEKNDYLNNLINEKEALIYEIEKQRADLQQKGKETTEATKRFEARLNPIGKELTRLKADRDSLDSDVIAKIEQLKNEAIKQKNSAQTELLQSFLDEKARVDTSTVNLSFELPSVLWDEYWLEAQEDRNRRIQDLLQRFRAALSPATSNSLTVASIKDQRKNILQQFIGDIALVLIVDLDSSPLHGIRFLRKFWANLLKYSVVPAPTVFLTLHNLQELIRQDKRYFALLAEDVEVLTIPFLLKSLKDTIKYRIMKLPSIDSARSYLKQSADLAAAGIMEHRWKNIAAPYSLMIGASYAQELTRQEKYELLKRFHASPAGMDDGSWDEVSIYSALASAIDMSLVQPSVGGNAPEKTLRDLMKGKKILLIDDKAEAYGLAETIKALCSPYKLKVISGNWKDYGSFRSDKNLTQILDSTSIDELEKYDLILLDLYLTEDDETIKNTYRNIQPPEGVTFGGLRFLQEINSKAEFTVPVILFTASTRHFNIEAAERTGKGIEGYFEKKGCYHDIVESTKYYQEFKELLRMATSDERALLRYAWKGIVRYKNKVGNSKLTTQYLESVYHSIKTYLRDRNDSLLMGCTITIGSIIEQTWSKLGYVFNPCAMQTWLSKAKDGNVSQESIYAFIAHQIRGSGAHPEAADITLEDVFFAFFALLRSFSITDKVVLYDQCASWVFNKATAEQMIVSVRTFACPTTSALCTSKTKDSKRDCTPSATTAFECASRLSLSYNLGSKASKNQLLFKYLFFMQCLDVTGYSVPDVFLHLFKLRFSRCVDFHAPFKIDPNGEFYWVGRKRPDGSLMSALGTLDYTMYQNGKPDGEFVLFHPTPKYLRG